MAKIVDARAWCNNEVAYLAWKTDEKIKDCLGFMVTRIHLDDQGGEVERRVLPAWVAFETQSNPDWEPQDASVWPVQKFSWRDLTLRKSRNTLTVRQDAFKAKYEIVAVGLPGAGRKPVPPSASAQPDKYKGKPIPLFFCSDPFETNEILVSSKFGDISVAFTNGILSTQNLRKQLDTAIGKAPTKSNLDPHIKQPGDKIREFLAGDVLSALRSMFQRAEDEDGELYLALYELADAELIDLLTKHQKRCHLILSTAGSGPENGTGARKTANRAASAKSATKKSKAKTKSKAKAKLKAKTKSAKGPQAKKVVWDTTNAPVRKALAKLMGSRLQNRMFNNSAHIGHNKFAVLVVGNKPVAVWTGSTNWTPTGLCAQTNNTVIVESADVAQAYLDFWNRLHADKLQDQPFGAPNKNDQGKALRTANMTPNELSVDRKKTAIELWCSPNTEKTGTPQNRTVPPDLAVVFDHMKQAKHAILFLVFNPGRSDPAGEDVNTVVSAGIELGRLDPKLFVSGAISDPTALPGYVAPPRGEKKDKSKPKIPLPAIFTPAGAPNVLMIRAAAVNDLVGDFQRELLSAGHAIIHDKIVVIDPLSETDCVVITGSHNLGFKASYANDENMLIIRGNRDLAAAYAVHVLDVYDHYKFRAVLEQQAHDAMAKGQPRPTRPTGKGFLQTTDKWQDPYVSGQKGRELAYFLS